MTATTASAATGWALLLPWLPVILVTLGLGIPTLLISREQKRIAAEQRRVAQAKLKLDLFDRRLAIFALVWNTLRDSLQWRYDKGYLSMMGERIQSLRDQQANALFLFGPEIESYLRDSANAVEHRIAISISMRANGAATPEQTARDVALAEWLSTEAVNGARLKFAPYLDFAEWQ